MDSKTFLKIALLIFIGAILLFTAYSFRGLVWDENGISDWLPKLSFNSGGFINFIGNTGGGRNILDSSGSGSVSLEEQSELEKLIAQRGSEWPEGFTEGDISPWYQKVTITARASAQPFSSSYPSRITLSSNNLAEDETINVTGWELKSADDVIRIGQAIEKYPPYAAPSSAVGDINLSRGERVEIYSTESVINYNIRNNKCFGYLQNKLEFEPQINSSCPAIDYADFYKTTGTCQDDVRRFTRCEEPDPDKYNSLSNECRSILDNKLSYAGCLLAHQKDDDWLKSDWHVWAGRNILDQHHDWVVLLDRDGKLVDDYRY